MSLIVIAVLAGGSAVAATLAARYARRKAPQTPEPAEDQAESAPAPSKKSEPVLSRVGFSVELGDVVEILGRELWLEHGWLLSEAGDPIAALFQASEATVVALPPPSMTLYLVTEVELAMPEEPPASIENAGVRFERVRRLPVSIAPLGKTPPLPWDEAVLGEYRGLAGDALWVLGRAGKIKAWQGRIAREGDVERWGGGADTL